MNKEEILNRIRQNNEVDIPTLQKEFNASYKEIKQIVDELVKSGKLAFVAGIKYVCVEDKPPVGTPRRRPVSRRLGEQTYMDIADITDKLRQDIVSDADGSGKKKKNDTVFVSMRRTPVLEIDKDDVKEEKKVENKSIINSLLEDDGLSKRPMFTIEEILERHIKKSDNPVTADVIPTHPAWIDEKRFRYEVKERLERLIKSDKKMKHSGAVKKAEMLLEAVRDTNDNKMIQVYERMLYELLTADGKLYEKLKNRYFCE